MKKLICLFLTLLILTANAYACTGVYVGKKASIDGSYIIARSNDNQGVYPTRVMVVPRVEQFPDREMPRDARR